MTDNDKVDKWESKHVVRAPDQLWKDFGEACADKGTDRSSALRAYMRRYTAAWKGRRGRTGDTPTPDEAE